MKKIGIRGILMLVTSLGLSWFLIRHGHGWEPWAKIISAFLAPTLGFLGLTDVIAAVFVRKCYAAGCQENGTKWCDFKDFRGLCCSRWCCRDHRRVVGKCDYCQGHWEAEGGI
jgi:hypothetical protein